MKTYLFGLVRAVMVHGMAWWISLIVGYILGFGAFENYPKFRDGINGLLGRSLMPDFAPAWWAVLPFLIWVIMALAHREAMRHWRAARIVYGEPYECTVPLFHRATVDGIAVSSALQFYVSMIKVEVRNDPYKLDEGKDAQEAWGEIELFRMDSSPFKKWRYPRWEENNLPGYGTNPTDHFPDKENLRTLAANGKPHILNVAVKPLMDEMAYPLRGTDQLHPDWRSTDVIIPPGKYLARIHIHAKGTSKPAAQTFLFENRGVDAGLELSKTNIRIERHWS